MTVPVFGDETETAPPHNTTASCLIKLSVMAVDVAERSRYQPEVTLCIAGRRRCYFTAQDETVLLVPTK